MKKWVVFALLMAKVLYAEEVLVESLNRIVLLSEWTQVVKGEAKGDFEVVSKGVRLLDQNQYFLGELKQSYLGKPLTERMIQAIKAEIAGFYQAKNQPFVVIGLPKQELTGGTLQIVVNEAKLGEVIPQGNRYVSGTHLKNMLRAAPGKPIVTQEVFEDLAWMNQNPFRRTDAIFTPGDKPGTTDIELVTVDRWPYRFYIGADDTGTEPTERDRIFFGFNFGNTIWSDAQLSYQFTCAPNWNRFFAHTVNYRIPLPWRHTIVFFGGYAEVEPAIGVEDATEKGVSWQVDGRYRVPIMESSKLMQSFSVGYDFKEVQNRIKYNNVRRFKGCADINQFMVGYELGFKDAMQKTSLVLEVFVNPGGITHNNKTSSYQEFRYGANSHYGYLKVAHSYTRKLQWESQFSYDLSGQIASQNLLPSEQLTLAGYNAVRGFEERIVNVDNGLVGNVELESPHWSIWKTFGSKEERDAFYVLLFFDAAIGADHKKEPGVDNFKSLGSIGPGARYQWSRYVMARIDYGFQLWHHGFENPTNSRYNFGFIISY